MMWILREVGVVVLVASAAQGLVRPASPVRGRPGAAVFGSRVSEGGDLSVDCLVVGGGISGCSLAHNLHVRGVDVVLAEARDYLGGNVISHKEGGFVWEEGPNSFATQPSIVRIASELGIADELVFADESLPLVLDVGCGFGVSPFALAARTRGVNVLAVDRARHAILYGRALVARRGLGGRWSARPVLRPHRDAVGWQEWCSAARTRYAMR